MVNRHNWRNGPFAELTAPLPCFYCSGHVGHILDDGVYSKASAPSSGRSPNFNSDALLTLETDGSEATVIK